MNPDIIKIKYWLTRKGNSTLKLASALGYRSSGVIYQWIYRGELPKNKAKRILDYIDADLKPRRNRKAISGVGLRS